MERTGHFFRPCELVLIPQFLERSKLYHFNVLKCNLCFTINIWQSLIIFRTISVLKPSRFVEGTFTVFFLTSKQTTIIDL